MFAFVLCYIILFGCEPPCSDPTSSLLASMTGQLRIPRQSRDAFEPDQCEAETAGRQGASYRETFLEIGPSNLHPSTGFFTLLHIRRTKDAPTGTSVMRNALRHMQCSSTALSKPETSSRALIRLPIGQSQPSDAVRTPPKPSISFPEPACSLPRKKNLMFFFALRPSSRATSRIFPGGM